MNCIHCHDTGSLSMAEHGHLDCPHCDVAEERYRLEAWASNLAPRVHRLDVWTIYKHGKAKAAVASQ
jgi:hypothetical protein